MKSSTQGVQGWRQFLTSRAKMIAAYDQARVQAQAHEAETYHGVAGEKSFRLWLSDFLPKRYGVTSGYVMSQGFADTAKLPHYDVIIYDRLEAPVVWKENVDTSETDMSQAIPAEHVRAVLEIKAAFTPKAAASAMQHLGDLEPLLTELDPPEEPFKCFLPANFFSAVVFFELRRKEQYSTAALHCLAQNLRRGFLGGIILRADGRAADDAGLIEIVSPSQILDPFVAGKKTSLLNDRVASQPAKHGSEEFAALLSWSSRSFSKFAFDIVALLAGTWRPGALSSLYGLAFDGE